MKVEYDRESDILYIKFRDSKIKETRMMSEEVYIDLDDEGNLVGIEIWRASENAIIPISREITERIKPLLESSAQH
ncbi:DUF2283 domain-containing protein [Candidatus Bathyarchaeota archaeon]|nr:DUF2283 domain-containing protein [Candidatus Bathyarchaeota archaeon]